MPPEDPMACPEALPQPPAPAIPRGAGRAAAVSTPPEARKVKSCLLSIFQAPLN